MPERFELELRIDPMPRQELSLPPAYTETNKVGSSMASEVTSESSLSGNILADAVFPTTVPPA